MSRKMQTSSKPILIVEDDPTDREMITLAFKRAGAKSPVITACDGQDALDYLSLNGPYVERRSARRHGDFPIVILLDLDMPHVNGYEFLRRVKKDLILASIPVVVLTTSQSDSDLTESYALGAGSCLTKPVDFHELIELAQEVDHYWCTTNRVPGSR